jgi:hypothetical protein
MAAMRFTRVRHKASQLWFELERAGEQLFHQTGVLWLAHEDDSYPLKPSRHSKPWGLI